jgi:hypothetical protein
MLCKYLNSSTIISTSFTFNIPKLWICYLIIIKSLFKYSNASLHKLTIRYRVGILQDLCQKITSNFCWLPFAVFLKFFQWFHYIEKPDFEVQSILHILLVISAALLHIVSYLAI